VEADSALVDELSWRLHGLGASGIEVRDDRTMTAGEGAGALLLAGFADAASRDSALAALAGAPGVGTARAVEVADDGWSTRWREFFRPVVLERLQVVTPWMTPPRPDLPAVVIDPGQAFGTGGHPTTRLILAMLEQRAARGGLPGRVLDVGTGSGVLAIAAVLLGAGEALGIDIDGEAVAAARENAAANGVAGRVRCLGSAVRDLGETWPLVLANIELPVFRELAPAISARVAAGGELLVSGLLEEQAEAGLALFPGFEHGQRPVLDGWTALALRRP
jgi:ribosomal protein L11 methyltransferase